MKNINLSKIILFCGISAFLVSCFKDPGTDLLLSNVSQVEINEATTSGGANVSKSYNKIPGGPVNVKDSIRVNLVGAQRSTAVNVSFVIDPTSTAVPATHYDMITTSTVVIPAKSSFAFIYFNVHPQVINPGEVFKLKINLTSADVPVSVNYGTFTRSIRITCPFLRSSFVGAYNALEPGYGTYSVTMSADPSNANGVINSNFWDAGAVINYVFDPVAAKVTIPLQPFSYGGTNYTVQSGAAASSYDACIGKFIVPYVVKLASSGTTVDTNTHTFTKP